MKLNSKDLKDLEGVVYWSSAAKADLEGIESPHEYVVHATEMIDKASKCAERIMLGENRK